jgi:succinyl-CoA synthetase beta subunit
MLDEVDAGTLIERFGVPRAPAVVVDVGMTRAPSLPFGYPVVVKALSAELAHKTEAGGVVLNVANGDALLAAIRQIRANVAQRRPNTRVLRVLVQPMVAGIGEALVGYRVDPDAGPLVMVAAGGILTEIYRDRSLRLAPVDLAIAREMIDEVRAFKALAGFRGRPKGDLDALAEAIVSMSRLAEEPSVAEAEINPLIVRSDGVVAVDALVKLG